MRVLLFNKGNLNEAAAVIPGITVTDLEGHLRAQECMEKTGTIMYITLGFIWPSGAVYPDYMFESEGLLEKTFTFDKAAARNSWTEATRR